MAENILVVDDEDAIASLLQIYLQNDGYSVYTAASATEGLACVKEHAIDLAILDVMLPDMDGYELCRRIRENHYFPIIMLTAKNTDSDILNGLTMGADDYITKPFKPAEVVARVKTQLRRYLHYNSQGRNEESDSKDYDIRGLSIHTQSHKAILFNEELSLTPIEFSILVELCSHQGEVVTSEELFERVWKEKYMDSNNTVMTHIGRLREKMHENARKPKFIKTVWGVGYTID